MLEKYQGNYVTAESANNYIDINAIVSGCKNLANALSIGGDTLLDSI